MFFHINNIKKGNSLQNMTERYLLFKKNISINKYKENLNSQHMQTKTNFFIILLIHTTLSLQTKMLLFSTLQINGNHYTSR